MDPTPSTNGHISSCLQNRELPPSSWERRELHHKSRQAPPNRRERRDPRLPLGRQETSLLEVRERDPDYPLLPFQLMEELTPTFSKRNVILSPAFKMKRKNVRFSKLKGFKDNENFETLFKCLKCLVKVFKGPSKIVKKPLKSSKCWKAGVWLSKF